MIGSGSIHGPTVMVALPAVVGFSTRAIVDLYGDRSAAHSLTYSACEEISSSVPNNPSLPAEITSGFSGSTVPGNL